MIKTAHGYSMFMKRLQLYAIAFFIIFMIIKSLCFSHVDFIDVPSFEFEGMVEREKERTKREGEEKEKFERAKEEEDEERDELFTFPLELREKVWAQERADEESDREADRRFLDYQRNEFDSSSSQSSNKYERNGPD